MEVHGRFSADNAAACNAAAVAGLGIGVAALWQVRSLLDQGRLETVLDDWQLSAQPVHIVWPPTRQLPAHARLYRFRGGTLDGRAAGLMLYFRPISSYHLTAAPWRRDVSGNFKPAPRA